MIENLISKRREIKSKFRNKEIIFGGWVSYPEVSIAETLANIDIDFLVIDMEHSSISLDEAKKIILTSHSKKIGCFPRPVSHSNEYTKPLLEFGSDGIFYPMVDSKEQLINIIKNFKYPPMGNRSFGLNRAQNYGFNFEDYISSWNDSSSLILQIESKSGADNIDEILSHDEVDGVMIGPYDLSGSYGYPGQLDHPEVLDACKKILESCNRYNKSCGTQITDISKNNILKQINLGFNFIILSSDLFILWKWSENMQNIIKEIK